MRTHGLKRALLVLGFAFVCMVSPWPQHVMANADTVRKAILEVPMWHVDVRGGFILWHFEMRSGKLWGQSMSNLGKSLPAVEVEVTEDGLTWAYPDGLRITLRY